MVMYSVWAACISVVVYSGFCTSQNWSNASHGFYMRSYFFSCRLNSVSNDYSTTLLRQWAEDKRERVYFGTFSFPSTMPFLNKESTEISLVACILKTEHLKESECISHLWFSVCTQGLPCRNLNPHTCIGIGLFAYQFSRIRLYWCCWDCTS